MRALITGSRGFVGRNLAKTLKRSGWDVHGVDLRDGPNGDARTLFRHGSRRYDLVVHAAAYVGGRIGIDTNAAFIATYNSGLDAAMFEWALRTRPGRIVYFSSSAVYPATAQKYPGYGGLQEDAVEHIDFPEGPPESSYGWVKYWGEYLAAQVQAEGIPVHVFRPFSGFGTDQSCDYPFPSFIQRALAREDPFTVWGPGTQVRDFVHVDDVTTMVLATIDQDPKAELGPLNIGTGIGTNFVELAELVTALAGYHPKIVTMPDMPTGVMHRVADTARSHRIYQPRITLTEGIERALRTSRQARAA
jgi:nucleoside-diphosphate-sugar epimerase